MLYDNDGFLARCCEFQIDENPMQYIVLAFSSSFTTKQIGKITLRAGGLWVKNHFSSWIHFPHGWKCEATMNWSMQRNMSKMAVVQGMCLKCKTYGPIKDGQLIKMKNGRTRMAGFCSQQGCTGKISKIVSWCIRFQPMRFNTPFRWANYLGARGLGVMTSPWHGEDREFNSLRAHH